MSEEAALPFEPIKIDLFVSARASEDLRRDSSSTSFAS